VPPQPTWPGPPVSSITAWSLVQAGHLAGRRFHTELNRAGLTPTQFGVLLQLDLHPGMSSGQMARAVLVTPQSMSGLLASLADRGLIKRSEPTGRGRAITAELTPAGQDVLGRCSEAVQAVEHSLGLGASQAAVLNDLLQQIIDSAS
jgi:DNA-binding MarR family transcriptional regulator